MNDTCATVTVIVRTIGRSSLEAALASIDLQARSDVHVVVVDASGKGQQLPLTTCPVRVVSEGTTLHRTRAANVGLDAVQTRWALFLDDDDVLLAGHLDKLTQALAEVGAVGDAVLAHTGVALLRADGPVDVIDQAFEPWELLLGNCMPIHAALFDAALAQAQGLRFDETLDVYEDWDFWLQMQCLGRFVHVPGVSAHYRIGADSSAVHQWPYGAPAYWCIWQKWWSKAPAAWWVQALRAGVDFKPTLAQWQGTQAQLSHVNVQLQEAYEKWHADVQSLRQTQVALTHQVAQTAAVQTALQVTQAERDATQARLQATQAERDTMQMALAASRIEHARTGDELHQMQQSSSWRITRPLRRCFDLLRLWRARAGALRRSAPWRRWATMPGPDKAYGEWMAQVEAPESAQRSADLAPRTRRSDPLISIVMPVFNPQLKWLDEALVSVQNQTWPHWQLCMADDASTQPGVREHLRAWAAREPRISWVEREKNGHISAASNSALALAKGEWVAMLDQDDVLSPCALIEIVNAIDSHPQCGLIYSDEDKLDARGRRFEPHFKPAFQMDLLYGHNFINHLVAYRRQAVWDVGAWRNGFDGSQDHDLALRMAAVLPPEGIIHIPRVLYHWRTGAGSTAGDAACKPYAQEAALRAVADHLKTASPGAQVEGLHDTSLMRVRYPQPSVLPRVEIKQPQDRTAVAPDSLVLVLREGLPTPTDSCLQELIAQVSRRGVGVVAACIRDRQGRLLEGGYFSGANGELTVAWRGNPVHAHGPFGCASLAQGFDAVNSACMMMRAELWPLWLSTGPAPAAVEHERARSFGALVSKAGWRLIWTPHAVVTDS